MFGRHILVTGALRSGTTWVGRTIAYDRSIEYVHEPFNGYSQSKGFRYKFGTWFFYVPGTGEEEPIYQELDRLLRSRTHPFHRALLEAKKGAFNVSTPLCFARHLVLRTAFPRRGLIKDPVALMSAAWLFERFRPRVICMIRNPLAFVGSIKKWGWNFDFDHLRRQPGLMAKHLHTFASDIDRLASERASIVEQGCLLWNIFHSMILEYRARFSEWLFLRHEDLAVEPEAGFKEVFAYLQLRFSDEIRSRISSFTSGAHAAETDHWQLTPRDSHGSLQTWRERLSRAEAQMVLERTHALAARFYRIDGDAFV